MGGTKRVVLVMSLSFPVSVALLVVSTHNREKSLPEGPFYGGGSLATGNKHTSLKLEIDQTNISVVCPLWFFINQRFFLFARLQN